MEPQPIVFPNLVRVRVAVAPRAEPFDESMDSLNVAIAYAQKVGFKITFEKVRRGCPGFQNAGPTLSHLLESGDTHLFIAADDMLYPPDTIVRLVNDDKDVVNGIYRKNMTNILQPANYIESGELFTKRFKAGGLYETKFASGHTMTIKRHVIEKMIVDYPDLAYQQGDQTHYALFIPMIVNRICYQDDWSFSHRARQSGFTLWDDYDCKLKHYCYDFLGFESLEVNNGGE
jgi:hypothetical protein